MAEWIKWPAEEYEPYRTGYVPSVVTIIVTEPAIDGKVLISEEGLIRLFVEAGYKECQKGSVIHV